MFTFVRGAGRVRGDRRVRPGHPAWLHAFAETGTDAGLLVFAALYFLAWWRARRLRPRDMALVLLGPVAVTLTYLFSEVVKVVVREDRPCRGLVTIATCPEAGDWSFPSNHAVIAAAAAAPSSSPGARWPPSCCRWPR
nr:hypothetical protein GCM10020093_071980 [Planobispora longispora]